MDDGWKVLNVTGILHVESKNLRVQLLNSTNRCLDTMKEVLQKTARTTCQALLYKYQGKIKALQANPRNLKEFAEFAKTINKTEQESKVMFQGSATVEDMYPLVSPPLTPNPPKRNRDVCGRAEAQRQHHAPRMAVAPISLVAIARL